MGTIPAVNTFFGYPKKQNILQMTIEKNYNLMTPPLNKKSGYATALQSVHDDLGLPRDSKGKHLGNANVGIYKH